MGSHLSLNLTPCGRWALRDNGAQRRLALHYAVVGRRGCDSDRYHVREAGQGPVEFGAPARSDHLQTHWEPGVGRQSVGEWYV